MAQILRFPAPKTECNAAECVEVKLPRWASDDYNFALVEIMDDSLPPARKGGYVLIYRIDEVRFYHPSVVRFNNKTLARVIVPLESGSVLLATSNPDYPCYVAERDDFEFLGVVLEVWSDKEGHTRWVYQSSEFEHVTQAVLQNSL